ncbi:NYN domain-containing protein [Halalkalibacterium halodurans]|jgi:predicted RNA-binding protein with PIN domain|uniref:BH0114 protein n=2 Tax=Halalkalibacterium halodurans TaxID=86665 RepID=Q9KGF1_HALH5|nr:NYN domain-containing protein [Halalkalibacterium halodurans]MDY7220616.1 NYN domain-containing protein [Halalkalibacterium halodurans]MDY7239855.1 NYN domain-containing protein [Halalkalibacterium halodurans]MED3647887.1 NYN domain-containing protein [Halalkalibacterium halodurans]MED4081220.1 NYN domain-containing protein [Halalkalibacterium halodurans]MED4083935.1 NYN domain-containing protein [Halalkalibacterium halodurans]
MREILIVDGYNMIGAWPELKELKDRDLALARDKLIDRLAEYQAYTGCKVILVFDAHMVPGVGRTYNNHRIEVIYTRKNETADERIERLVRELKRIDTQIYVATSDLAEQSHIFGSGALRKSARELYNEMEVTGKGIEKTVEKSNKEHNSTKIALTEELAEIFEKWRRGDR